MAKSKKKTSSGMANLNLTTDAGQAKALNLAWHDYEEDGDHKVALTRSAMVGRGVAIRTLRLREEQFKRGKK